MVTLRLCVLWWLSAMTAISVLEYRDYSNLFGAATGTLPNCKKECKNWDDLVVKECLDPWDHSATTDPVEADRIGKDKACNKRYCTINSFRGYKCESGDPASGNECKWKDCAGYRRKHVIHEEACATTGHAESADADWVCKRHGSYAGWETPCKTDTCGTGVVKHTHEYGGRRCCD